MSGWKGFLKGDPTDWLLEDSNPSVRTFALMDLLDAPPDAPEVWAARSALMQSGIVPRILAKQHDGGYWEKPENFYVYGKYRGTVWTLIVLASLGAAGDETRICAACEFILAHSQNRESGCSAVRGDADSGGRREDIIPCLTENMLWSLIRFGWLGDPRVRRGFDWIAAVQCYDDGDTRPPREWPYTLSDKCWGRHTCMMGVVKALKALEEIPPAQRGGPGGHCERSGLSAQAPCV